MVLFRWFMIATCALLVCTPATAQIQLEDREIEGKVGLTNTTLAVPDINPGAISARSVGLADPFNNIGVVFDGTPQERDYSVVVQAFDLGQYWLSAVLQLGPQRYRFGYAANSFAATGYPNFINDVYLPVTTPATPASPDPIGPVDLLECAGRVRTHFIESDGGGGFVPSSRLTGASVYAFPRADPAQAAPPFSYRGGGITAISGGAQAQRNNISAGTQDADLFVRSTSQSGGPDVRYRIAVDWSVICETNPLCPEVIPSSSQLSSVFEGLTGNFGPLGTGGMASPAGDNAGIDVVCEGTEDLFVVLTEALCPCPPDAGVLEGCANLIGEAEFAVSSRTQVRDFGSFGSSNDSISNIGDSPAPFSTLFDNFDPLNSEGFYTLVASSVGTRSLRSFFALNPIAGVPQNLFGSGTAAVPPPAAATTETGADFCMVPGIYQGTVTLRDAAIAGLPTGAVEHLDLESSFLRANTNGGGDSRRDFRGGSYDFPTGVYTIPYENIFGNPNNLLDNWFQRRIDDRHSHPSTDFTLFTQGGSLIDFTQPSGETAYDPFDFISTTEGGLWTGALVPGTEIAERSARLFPVDYELCYSTLRIQVDSTSVQFFNPLIDEYSGAFQDDSGTPAFPDDDVVYGVFDREQWLGSPSSSADAATTGFVNLQLPQGDYTGISGFISTVLGPGLFGITELPAIDVSLSCGESCTATPNAIVCLSPIEGCNNGDVVALDQVQISGTLNHELPIVDAFYRIGEGSPVPIDLVAAGVTCGPAPCADPFNVTVSGFQPCRNRIEVTFVDDGGNSISGFLGTTVDTTDPVFGSPPFACGSQIDFSPPSSCDNVPRNLVPLPLATDDCSTEGDPDSPLIITDDVPAFFPPGATVVNLAAVDSCGNGAFCDLTVFIEDTTPPDVSCGAAGITLPADEDCTAIATISAAISDNCDPLESMSVTAHVTLANGTMFDIAGPVATLDFPLGLSTVDFEVVDTNGNSTSCTAPIDVIDVDAPTLACPFFGDTIGDGVEYLDGIALHAFIQPGVLPPSVELDWSGTPGPYIGRRVVMPPTGVDPMMRVNGVSLFEGEFFTDFQDAGVLLDGVDYFYRIYQLGTGTGTFECESPEGSIVSVVGETSDNCAVESVSNSRTGGTLDASDLYPLGQTTISFISTDTSTNSTTCESVVEIVDTTPPVITCPDPLSLVRNVSGDASASDPEIQAWLNAVIASDVCGGVTIVNDSPTSFPVGCSSPGNSTTVSFTATDERGLQATCSSTLTILLSCDDANACTTDSCVEPGSCEHTDISSSCDDGNVCTTDSCDPLTGCDNDDVSVECDDGISCTVDYCDPDLGCQADLAEGSDDLGADCPRTIGFYKRLCSAPHPEDELTAEDAECVNDAATFSWIASVDDICDVLHPNPANDKCEQAESQFMALMLNLCKAHVTTAAAIDSTCTNNQTVGESAAEADLLLSSPGRTFNECLLAQCECEEINSGIALGIPTN